MDLLKNHYEKIVLSVVLLALAVVAAYLPIEVSNVRSSLAEFTGRVLGGRVDPLPPLNLSTNQAVLDRLHAYPGAPFSRNGHNVFNPVRWVKGPDGMPIPEEDLGIKQLQVAKITPLYTRVSFDDVRDSGQTIRYQVKEVQETSTKASEQRGVVRYMTPGDKTDLFRLVEAQGPAGQPTGLVIELLDSNQQVVITLDRPYEVVSGYSADLRHAATNKTYNRERQDDQLAIGGETYKIVAIESDAVTLENVHTLKRTTIRP
ncbi:MAG: hypothetical protein H7A46_08435 [Verrucomicrobiales bacterium]|nr:hypothetical protein [Verrucomicrobiales bacterium]